MAWDTSSSASSEESSSSASAMHNILFDGMAKLHGRRALAALRRSSVAVIGLGGVGSWCAEALARSGVGTIVVADLDEVCASNTNRQLHATMGTYGRSKCAVMAERLRQINPELRVHVVEDFITENNVASFVASGGGGLGEMERRLDFVIDCVDDSRHKAAIIAECKDKGVSVITTGGCGGLANPSGIQVDDLSNTHGDKLLAKVRMRLRRKARGSDSTGEAADDECNGRKVSTEENEEKDLDNEMYELELQRADAGRAKRNTTLPMDVTAVYSPLNADAANERKKLGNMSCANGAGSAVYVTGVFGFVAAGECVSQILKNSESANAIAPPTSAAQPTHSTTAATATTTTL